MTTNAIAVLIVGHLVADWYCQGDWEATNKSRRFDALAYHCLVYVLALAPFALSITAPGPHWGNAFSGFICVNLLAHGIVDAITSRCAAYYYEQQNRSMFFNTIGTDQAIHMLCLVYTAENFLVN